MQRACVRELRTLNINYTQLTIKVKFFFKKEQLFQKTWRIGSVFERLCTRVSVEVRLEAALC